jgi:hypothetical protein
VNRRKAAGGLWWNILKETNKRVLNLLSVAGSLCSKRGLSAAPDSLEGVPATVASAAVFSLVYAFCCFSSPYVSYLQHIHAFLDKRNDEYILNNICVSHTKFYVSNKVCIFF